MTSATLPKTQMINLGLGYPADALLPHSVFEQASQHRFAQGDAYFLQYGDEWGDPHLREQLAAFLNRHYDLQLNAQDLLISGGISGGLDMVCTMLAGPGQSVIIESTTYFASPDIMQSHGLNVISAPMDDEGLELTALEALIRQHRPRLIYTIPTHHNPTGLTQSRERREALVALAEKYDLYIVADEVYHLLTYRGETPPSYSSYVDSGRVISLGTFSKILAPGLRVGWIHARRDMLEYLVTNPTLQSAGGTNPIGASMVSSVLELGLMDRYLGEILETFGARARVMVESLRAPAFADCSFREPDGGYFVWLRLPPGMVAEQLEPRAHSYGVTFKPGNLFAVDGQAPNYIRLCFAFNDEDQIREGIARLGEAIVSMQQGELQVSEERLNVGSALGLGDRFCAVRWLRHPAGGPADHRAPLVFLHDSLGSAATWRDFPQTLAQASGRHALIYDRFGYGHSDDFVWARDTDYLNREADEVLPALLDAAGVERAVLFGHSDGASIALLAAALRPERVAGAVTESGHIFNENLTRRGVEAAAQAYQTGDIAERLRRYHGTPERVQALYRAWTDTWLSEEYRDWTIEPLLGRIQAPLLVMQGRDDEFGTLAQVWRTAEAVQGPVQTLVLPHCGHTPHREAREAVLAAAVCFLDGLD